MVLVEKARNDKEKMTLEIDRTRDVGYQTLTQVTSELLPAVLSQATDLHDCSCCVSSSHRA